MGWNLIEDGFKSGERVYHVVSAIVNDDGEPEWEIYSDQWFSEEEWTARICPPPPLNNYRIFHRPTNAWWDGQAPSAQEACDKAGWPIGDCWVRQRTPVVDDPAAESGHRGGGWQTISPPIQPPVDPVGDQWRKIIRAEAHIKPREP